MVIPKKARTAKIPTVTGEAGGVLDEVLMRLSKLLEDMAKLQNEIKSAMAYPVTVGIFAVLAFLGM
ncbi:MAG: type II secretion system F family protein, partial [Cyanobacteria bacterium P01_C01_bin.72]